MPLFSEIAVLPVFHLTKPLKTLLLVLNLPFYNHVSYDYYRLDRLSRGRAVW